MSSLALRYNDKTADVKVSRWWCGVVGARVLAGAAYEVRGVLGAKVLPSLRLVRCVASHERAAAMVEAGSVAAADRAGCHSCILC